VTSDLFAEKETSTMFFNPERYMGAVCLLFVVVSAMMGVIEAWRGFGPSPFQQVASHHEVDKDEDDDRPA